jgi:preprotein translocase subunit SecA
VDPLVEYQKESFFAFQDMIASIKEGIVELIFKAKIKATEEEEVGIFLQAPKNFIHSQYKALTKTKEQPEPAKSPEPSAKKVGRNEPCPCGSGKKYKKCCGK